MRLRATNERQKRGRIKAEGERMKTRAKSQSS